MNKGEKMALATRYPDPGREFTIQDWENIINRNEAGSIVVDNSKWTRPNGHIRLNDDDLANRFAELFENVAKYVPDQDRWVVWNGAVWEFVDDARVLNLTQAVLMSFDGGGHDSSAYAELDD